MADRPPLVYALIALGHARPLPQLERLVASAQNQAATGDRVDMRSATVAWAHTAAALLAPAAFPVTATVLDPLDEVADRLAGAAVLGEECLELDLAQRLRRLSADVDAALTRLHATTVATYSDDPAPPPGASDPATSSTGAPASSAELVATPTPWGTPADAAGWSNEEWRLTIEGHGWTVNDALNRLHDGAAKAGLNARPLSLDLLADEHFAEAMMEIVTGPTPDPVLR